MFGGFVLELSAMLAFQTFKQQRRDDEICKLCAISL